MRSGPRTDRSPNTQSASKIMAESTLKTIVVAQGMDLNALKSHERHLLRHFLAPHLNHRNIYKKTNHNQFCVRLKGNVWTPASPDSLVHFLSSSFSMQEIQTFVQERDWEDFQTQVLDHLHHGGRLANTIAYDEEASGKGVIWYTLPSKDGKRMVLNMNLPWPKVVEWRNIRSKINKQKYVDDEDDERHSMFLVLVPEHCSAAAWGDVIDKKVLREQHTDVIVTNARTGRVNAKTFRRKLNGKRKKVNVLLGKEIRKQNILQESSSIVLVSLAGLHNAISHSCDIHDYDQHKLWMCKDTMMWSEREAKPWQSRASFFDVDFYLWQTMMDACINKTKRFLTEPVVRVTTKEVLNVILNSIYPKEYSRLAKIKEQEQMDVESDEEIYL